MNEILISFIVPAFWHVYWRSYLGHLQPVVCQYEIIDFCHISLKTS